MDNYILDRDGNPVVEPNFIRWCEWMGKNNRGVLRDTVGGCAVSTVFLATDHRFGGGGPPILFETMIFNYRFAHEYEYCERYCTREQAVVGHAAAVAHVKAILEAESTSDSPKLWTV